MYDSKYNLKGAIVCGSVLSIATYANIRNIFSDTQDDAIYDPLALRSFQTSIHRDLNCC